MADKTKEYKTKSIYFAKPEFELLDDVMDKCEATDKTFSDYVKELILQDLNGDKKLPKYMEDRIIELIKQYAPTVNMEEIKKDIKDEFDPDALAAINQFDNF